MPVTERLPEIINHVVGDHVPASQLAIATSNENKIAEYTALGIEVEKASSPDEIQDKDSFVVIEKKAIAAFELNGGRPTIVEDTSLGFDALGGLPGPYTKDFLATREQRFGWTERLPKDNRGATFRVLIGVYDGREVQIREGVTRGKISDTPKGSPEFGFDDIFIPDEGNEGQKTYGEMDLDEKNKSSARQKALLKLLKDPFPTGKYVFAMAEPAREQVDLIRLEEIATPQALDFAFNLLPLKDMTVNPELTIDVKRLPPVYRRELANGAVLQFTVDQSSAGQGIVLLPQVDLKTSNGFPERLKTDTSGDPILLQMGPEATKMALAIRATEYMEMHSDQMHEHIRSLARGEGRVQRPNKRSEALESMLGMKVETDIGGSHRIIESARRAVGTSELGYVRQYSEDYRSRKQTSRDGLLIATKHGPMSMLGFGGMPAVTGSRDVLVTSAMSYMQSWIPRNGIYAENFSLQLKLFNEAKAQIESFDMPDDIKEICIKRIGLAVGCENPQQIAQDVVDYYKAGGRGARIYTTNPDPRVVETAEAIKQRLTAEFGEQEANEFLLSVGPIVDKKQAEKLLEAGVSQFIVGHGGGENCTSLSGGGAANAVGLVYELSLDPKFNDSLIFMEGGVGSSYGPLLGMVDGFSISKKGIGGIESTGGIYVQHNDERSRPAFPYHGSASAATQLTESHLYPGTIAKKRLTHGASVAANEGVPNYFYKPDWVHSILHKIREQRALIGVALADQQASSLYEFWGRLADAEDLNIVGVTTEAHTIANAHTGRR